MIGTFFKLFDNPNEFVEVLDELEGITNMDPSKDIPM